MTIEAIKTFIQLNLTQICFTAVISFVVGFLLGMSTFGYNKEGRKKGFRKKFFTGHTKEIDKRLKKEYKEALREERMSGYLSEDDSQHHASRKFKSD